MLINIRDIYFIFVLLFSGLSTAFFRSQEGLILLWAVGLLIFWRESFPPAKPLLIALSVWMGYFVISTFIIGSFHPFFMGTYIARIMIAWWLLSHYKEQVFVKYENAVYVLAIISLFFYAIQMAAAGPLYSVLARVDLSQNLFPDSHYATILIYTIGAFQNLTDIFPRNAGFCWEPGPYSCYLVLAIFFNLVRDKLQFTERRRLLILLITLLTTQSTTGISALLVVVLWYAWSRYASMSYRLIAIPVALVVVLYAFTSVPYLQDKIVDESAQDVEEIIDLSLTSGGIYGTGRFAGFYLGWQDFKRYPIAGIGGNTGLQYAAQQGAQVPVINGFANIMSRYGSIGLAVFVWLLFTSGAWLARHHEYSGVFVFPALIVIISVGFGIVECPIIFTFLMVSGFLGKKERQAEQRRHYFSQGRSPATFWSII